MVVVLFHYTGHVRRYMGGAAAMPLNVSLGHYGVELFFIISGFVILMTLERSRTWRDFAFSRISRLYPAYWAAVTFTVVVAWVGRKPHRLWLGGFLTNLTMLQKFIGWPDLDEVYWSLAVELGFYALMLAIFAAGGLARVEMFSVGWLAVALGVPPLATSLGLPLPQWLRLLMVATYAPLFIAGMVLYRARSSGFTAARTALLVTCVGAEFVALGVETGVVVTVFVLCLVAAVLGHLQRLCVRPLLWLGAISFPLYLLHRNNGYLLMDNLYAIGVPPAICMAVAIAASLALASAFTYGIERPAMTQLRRWYRRSRG
jgi:peptidoglycan/LPS O-acetylase OafA/YrhL